MVPDSGSASLFPIHFVALHRIAVFGRPDRCGQDRDELVGFSDERIQVGVRKEGCLLREPEPVQRLAYFLVREPASS